MRIGRAESKQCCDILPERDLQDCLGRYQDLKKEWDERRKKEPCSGIDGDIIFEVGLLRQIEINIDYILLIVKKCHDSHSEDQEILITIRKAVDAGPERIALLNEHKATGGGFIAPMAVASMPQEKRPANCIGCRSCERVCPQQIKISGAMSAFSGMIEM